jgi:hypothetical protein
MDTSPIDRFRTGPTHSTTEMNIKVYCETVEKLNLAVDLIQLAEPDASISTWEPDGDEGTYGAFVDGIPDQLAITLGQLYEVSTD